MVYKTHKKKHVRRNKTSKLETIKRDKRAYTDNQIGEICSTGQYSTYEGNFYKNKKNLEKFAAISEKFRKDPKYKQFKTQSARYTKFLTDNFREGEIPKVIHQIRNDFYSYVNDEWFKENDIEKADKKYYVQFDNFRIVQEQVYYKLIDYVKKFIKDNPKSKKAIAINNVYRSLSENTIKSMFKHVDAVVAEMESYVEKDDMY